MKVYHVSDTDPSFSLLHPWVKSTDTDFITLPDATSSETAENVRLGVGVGSGPNLGLPQPSGGSQNDLDVRMRTWLTTQMVLKASPRG